MKSTILMILVAVAALGAALLLLSSDVGNQPRLVSDQRDVMGKEVVISVYDSDIESAEEAISVAFARMGDFESVASIHDAASELSELNRTSYLPTASDELIAMLRLANVVHQVSGGAFDVTAGALVELWKSNPDSETQFSDLSGEVQSASISVAMNRVGVDRILLGSGRKVSISLVPGTLLDVGPLAMGTATDVAIESLRNAGIEHALVRSDQHWRALGGMPDGSPWEVVLGDPDDTGVRFLLVDGAIAMASTCGHLLHSSVDPILDPRTGYPITLRSVAAVMAPTCAEAGALARSVIVLGTKSGLALIERLGDTEAMILACDDLANTRGSSGIAPFQAPFDD